MGSVCENSVQMRWTGMMFRTRFKKLRPSCMELSKLVSSVNFTYDDCPTIFCLLRVGYIQPVRI